MKKKQTKKVNFEKRKDFFLYFFKKVYFHFEKLKKFVFHFSNTIYGGALSLYYRCHCRNASRKLECVAQSGPCRLEKVHLFCNCEQRKNKSENFVRYERAWRLLKFIKGSWICMVQVLLPFSIRKALPIYSKAPN